MPHLHWSDDSSSLSNLETKYKVGIMLITIMVVMLQDDGLEFFMGMFGSAAHVAQMRQVFQMKDDLICLPMLLT
jgi:hypothetical protein